MIARKAFALVELLVIIAIIAVFAGLLLPALASTKQKARGVECVSNIGQINLAYSTYMQDSRKAMTYSAASVLWMKSLIDYQPSVAEMRLCPSAADRGTATTTEGDAKTPWYWNKAADPKLSLGSYGMNGWLYDWNPTGEIAWWVSVSDKENFYQKASTISHAAETPTFFDGIWPDTWPKISDQPALDLSKGDPNTFLGRLSIARHPLKAGKTAVNELIDGSINMAYADGHAAKLKLQEIKNVMWHAGYKLNANPWATGP